MSSSPVIPREDHESLKQSEMFIHGRVNERECNLGGGGGEERESSFECKSAHALYACALKTETNLLSTLLFETASLSGPDFAN